MRRGGWSVAPDAVRLGWSTKAISGGSRTIRRLLPTAMALLAFAAAAPAASAAVTLQPGAYHENGTSPCTMNFAYAGNGKTYLGTAAHCVGRVGEVAYDIEGVPFGKVAFIGDENSTEWDFAFIEVDAEDVGRVSAAVKGHPAYPKGSTTPS